MKKIRMLKATSTLYLNLQVQRNIWSRLITAIQAIVCCQDLTFNSQTIVTPYFDNKNSPQLQIFHIAHS